MSEEKAERRSSSRGKPGNENENEITKTDQEKNNSQEGSAAGQNNENTNIIKDKNTLEQKDEGKPKFTIGEKTEGGKSRKSNRRRKPNKKFSQDDSENIIDKFETDFSDEFIKKHFSKCKKGERERRKRI